MRIGLFAHRLAQDQVTGVGRYLRELVVALSAAAAEDDRLTLASTSETGSPDWAPAAVQTCVLPWRRRPVQAAWCFGLGPRLERALGRLDAVHLIQPFPPARTAAPQVVTIHDLFALEHRDWYGSFHRWTYRRSLPLVLRRASRVVVPSSYVADRLVHVLEVDRARIEVVPHGVSGAFSSPPSDREAAGVCKRFGVEPDQFAVCVGEVSTRKNVITLIRALALLPRPIPLVMVGPAGYGAGAVEAEIARLDGARVIRTGYLPDEETAGLVRGAAVLLHPALAEGFGFVPLEAMAAGTAVIVARTGSIPEVVGDGAVLVERAQEPSVWAEELGRLLEDPGRRGELAAAGQQRVTRFSWQRAAATMLEIYRQAVGTSDS